MALSGIARSEIMNRTRGMSDEELAYTLKFIPTTELLRELGRREGLIIDKLNSLCQTFDDMTIQCNKTVDEMTLPEKEDLLRHLRRCINGYE